jgi:hypothetical protein
MLQVTPADVVADPFPHVISDEILPPDLFRRLRAEYPEAEVFEEVAATTGSVGSRAGRHTGFDIYRGDTAYDRLMDRSPAWAEFDAFINSRAFIDQYHALFGRFADAMGLLADVPASTYNGEYCEPRELLNEKASPGFRVSKMASKFLRGFRQREAVELFTRLDITRSLGGYAKVPHCDRGNRLCSFILYFTDADADGLEGGDLLIYRAKRPVPMVEAPRHPRPEEVEVVAQLKPKPNRGVFFPCCNTSYHGVTAVTSEGIPRDFLYINISARAKSLW